MNEHIERLIRATQDIEARLGTLEDSKAELNNIADLLEANLKQLDEESTETKKILEAIAPVLRYLLERVKAHDEELKDSFESFKAITQILIMEIIYFHELIDART